MQSESPDTCRAQSANGVGAGTNLQQGVGDIGIVTTTSPALDMYMSAYSRPTIAE